MAAQLHRTSAALDTMSGEHVEADVALGDAWCVATHIAAVWLDGYMLRHLHAEETRIFPALDSLPRAQWDAIVAEMQARRR